MTCLVGESSPSSDDEVGGVNKAVIDFTWTFTSDVCTVSDLGWKDSGVSSFLGCSSMGTSGFCIWQRRQCPLKLISEDCTVFPQVLHSNCSSGVWVFICARRLHERANLLPHKSQMWGLSPKKGKLYQKITNFRYIPVGKIFPHHFFSECYQSLNCYKEFFLFGKMI